MTTKGAEIIKATETAVSVPDVNNIRELAKDLLGSGLFPAVKNVQGAVTVIQSGIELGIPPVAALNTMAVIKGRLSMEAKALLAVAARRAGVSWKVEENEEACKITFSRPGWPDITSTFTMAEARAAGLANKDNWKLYKRDMLFARAAGRGVRRIAPDAVLGIYAKEEMWDAPTSFKGERTGPEVIEHEPVRKGPKPTPEAGPEVIEADPEPVDFNDEDTLDGFALQPEEETLPIHKDIDRMIATLVDKHRLHPGDIFIQIKAKIKEATGEEYTGKIPDGFTPDMAERVHGYLKAKIARMGKKP